MCSFARCKPGTVDLRAISSPDDSDRPRASASGESKTFGTPMLDNSSPRASREVPSGGRASAYVPVGGGEVVCNRASVSSRTGGREPSRVCEAGLTFSRGVGDR